MNKVILVGRTVEAIELKKVGDNQKSTITTQLAVGRSYKDSEGNKETDFITLVAWGKTAEVLASMTAKGSPVGIEGELRSRSYEKDGVKRYVTEVLVDKVDLLESKAQTEERAKAAQA
jgi:single-strand binding protein